MWFFDVDGVLSPYQRGGSDAWLYWHARERVGNVPYRRSVVDRIARLHRTGLVDVRWLSTWVDDELANWQRVGLGPFPTGDRAAEGPYSWWKANTVHTWLTAHPDQPLIWTDDEIDHNPHRAASIRQTAGHRLLAISPDRAVGLTDEHLDRIEGWVERSVASVAVSAG